MRTVDVARRAGCSVQQVRNLERDGVLPSATRTATGYRIYGEIHLRSALAYRALAAGVGPVEAKKIVRAVHRFPLARVLALLDAAHARLDAERTELRKAEEAARAISGEPIEDVRASDAMSVSELAAALGVRPSTLRHWDAEGLVVPDRDPARGTRRYAPAQVRDARIVHQLRRAGYRIAPCGPSCRSCGAPAGWRTSSPRWPPGTPHHGSLPSAPRRFRRAQRCALAGRRGPRPMRCAHRPGRCAVVDRSGRVSRRTSSRRGSWARSARLSRSCLT
ncbi:MerR family transcriptional regulator [Streptosporangium lutulentum]